MGRLPGQNVTQVLALPPLTTRPFASTGMFRVLTQPPNALPFTRTTISTHVPFVEARATTPSPGLAAQKPPEDFLMAARSLPLSYTDFLSSVVPRSPFPFSTALHCSIFERIVHPYDPDAFDSLLCKHGLSSVYPLLPHNLRHGFPLGHMPALTEAVILPNNLSTYPYMHDVQDYLRKELLARRMSGPFSREEAELILCGPFFSSPLIVNVQPQQPGTPDKIRICRHLSNGSKLHPSVNSHIRKEISRCVLI